MTTSVTPEPATDPAAQPPAGGAAPTQGASPTPAGAEGTPPTPPRGPLSRREARQQPLPKREEPKQEAKAEEPKPGDAPKAEGGEPAPAGTEPKPAEGAAPAEPKPTEPEKTPAFVVEVPSEHPATRGKAVTIQVADEHQAQTLKALINGTYVRPREVEQLRAERDDYRQKLIRIESAQSATEKWMQSPEYQAAKARYTEIRDTIGQEAADEYWAGKQASFQKLADAEFTTKMEEVDATEKEQFAKQWSEEAYRNAAASIPQEFRALPDYNKWFEQALEAFDAELQQGHFPDLDAAEGHRVFMQYFKSRLLREPAFMKLFQQMEEANRTATTTAAAKAAADKAAEEKKKQEIIDQYKKDLAAKRVAAPPHPMGNLGRGVDRVAGAAPEGQAGPQERANLSPSELKRTLKTENREAFRQRMNRP